MVLDIDDTLFLERDYAKSGFQAVEAHFGIHRFAEVAWQAFEEGVRGNIFNVALERLGIDTNSVSIPELVRIYREHEPQIQLLDDAKWFLETHRDLIAGFVTDGPASSQKAKAKALGLAEFGPVCFTADFGEGFGKPHPRGFEWVCSQTPAAQYMYVADNPTKDFQGPRQLNWQTVRILRPGSLHEHLPTGDTADREIISFQELL